MKKSELKEIIREIVREELQEQMTQVKKYVRTTVPVLVGESVGSYIDAKLEEASSSKKRPLNESVITNEDWPMLDNKVLTTEDRPRLNRSQISSMLGYGDDTPIHNTVSTVVTDSGREVTIDQNKVPDYLVKALNKDYSGYLKRLDVATSGIRNK